MDLALHVWAGLPPDTVTSWRPTGPVRSLLTVENLASFHVHVGKARQPGDVVIYTGGFPSRAVMRAIKTVAKWCPFECYHWGDIDPSGVQIAANIIENTGVDFRPHLMEPRLARRHGSPAKPFERPTCVGTPFEHIGAFLAGSDAHHMEQEELEAENPVASHFPLHTAHRGI